MLCGIFFSLSPAPAMCVCVCSYACVSFFSIISHYYASPNWSAAECFSLLLLLFVLFRKETKSWQRSTHQQLIASLFVKMWMLLLFFFLFQKNTHCTPFPPCVRIIQWANTKINANSTFGAFVFISVFFCSMNLSPEKKEVFFLCSFNSFGFWSGGSMGSIVRESTHLEKLLMIRIGIED